VNNFHFVSGLECLRESETALAPLLCPRKISLLRGFSHSPSGKSMNQRSFKVSFVRLRSAFEGVTTKGTTLHEGKTKGPN
jgi:hypothetical protein